MIRRIVIVLALLLWAAPAFAQTRTLIAEGGWEGYGAPSPINAATGNYFFPPYNINEPNCFAINTIVKPPWDPNAAIPGGVDHYVKFIGGCSGGNPGPGIYLRLAAPHRAMEIVKWIRLDSNVTSSNLFVDRWNDSTNVSNTGVFMGAVDYASDFFDTSNRFNSGGVSTPSSAFVLGVWHQVDSCFIAGVNGSGTIPTAATLWVDQTLIGTGTPATTSPIGGGDTFTVADNELGVGAASTGPYLIFDVGASCPSSAYVPFYGIAVQPTGNNTVAFTPSANTNWQNVAGIAGALGFNSDATVGAQDYYNLTLPTVTNVVGVNERISVQQDAGGMRVALPLYNSGGSPTECPISNGLTLGGGAYQTGLPIALQVGTYQSVMCNLAAAPTQVGVQVNN